MFSCVLRRYAPSTVLVLKPFANFTEGADSVTHSGAISVDRCAEISCASMLWQSMKEGFCGRKATLINNNNNRAQELCESRGGRPRLPSLISLRFL